MRKRKLITSVLVVSMVLLMAGSALAAYFPSTMSSTCGNCGRSTSIPLLGETVHIDSSSTHVRVGNYAGSCNYCGYDDVFDLKTSREPHSWSTYMSPGRAYCTVCGYFQ